MTKASRDTQTRRGERKGRRKEREGKEKEDREKGVKLSITFEEKGWGKDQRTSKSQLRPLRSRKGMSQLRIQYFSKSWQITLA